MFSNSLRSHNNARLLIARGGGGGTMGGGRSDDSLLRFLTELPTSVTYLLFVLAHEVLGLVV